MILLKLRFGNLGLGIKNRNIIHKCFWESLDHCASKTRFKKSDFLKKSDFSPKRDSRNPIF